MDNKIKTAFGAVKANEKLKNKALAFVKEQTNNYAIRKTPKYLRIVPAAAACFILFFVAGISLYFSPAVKINIDINPSLELAINTFDKVISVTSLNDDGKELAESLDIKFMDYEEAIEKIIDNENIEAMLSEREIMTVTVIETSSEKSSQVLSQVKACVSGHGNIHCLSASSEEFSAAHELGLSCGKYRMYQQLLKLGSDITPEEINNMSMRRIRDLISSLSENNDNQTDTDNSQTEADNSQNTPSTGDGGHHSGSHEHGHNH